MATATKDEQLVDPIQQELKRLGTDWEILVNLPNNHQNYKAFVWVPAKYSPQGSALHDHPGHPDAVTLTHVKDNSVTAAAWKEWDLRITRDTSGTSRVIDVHALADGTVHNTERPTVQDGVRKD